MIRSFRIYFIFFLMCIIHINCHKSKEIINPIEDKDEISEIHHPLDGTAYKILFIGSSYFVYNNLPELFNNICNATEKEVIIESRIISGTYLDYHSTNSVTEEKIKSENWDFVVLQGVGRITAYPGSAHFQLLPVLEVLKEKIQANCEQTRMVYCMPWAFEDGMLWTPGGTDDYFDMQQKIYDNTLSYAGSVDFVISPVGWAWREIMLEEHPLHYLFRSDFNHPSLKGSYLMACVIYSTLFLESVEGVGFYSSLPSSEAFHFQEVASDIVLDNPQLWSVGE